MKPLQQQSALFRVVLADDNARMRDAVIQILEPEFVVVRAVSDGQAFVEAVLELKPDIGIIDISMPIMNGLEAATKLKKLGSDIKIVVLSVNEDRDYVHAAYDAGAGAYVLKRQLATDLGTALNEIISGGSFISSG